VSLPPDALASADPGERSRGLLARCAEHGFVLAGIADARPSAHGDAFRAWIDAGKQGAMGYLAEEIDRRIDPRVLVPGAASVLCVADRYADGRPDRRVPWEGSVARYARGEDYHGVIRARLDSLAEELRRLHPAHRFRVCVDTAPLLEREHAERAGLGRIGKHTLLIGARGAGTWIVIGALVSTLPFAALRADGLVPGSDAGDPCGSCTACIDACPTGAIEPWSVDGRTCISAVTIEQAGEVDPAVAGRMAGWIFGCDLCQEACPHSRPTRRSRALGTHEAYRAHWPAQLPLADVLGWSEADMERLRLNAVLRRADLSTWRRNAALAARDALRAPETPGEVRDVLRRTLEAIASDAHADGALRSAARFALAAG
jgi:epoxyqueuosine reductase